MRAHIIENGFVVNTIEVQSLDFMPGLVDAEAGGSIGDRHENGEFFPPEPVVDPLVNESLRAEAYRTESDPLFFKAQRGEATMDEWMASVAAIKARYPA